jgi:hypothetical protein
MNWIPLTTENQLDVIREQSMTKPVMIFKHSTRCSVSATVLDRLNRAANSDESNCHNYYLDLLTYRSISNAIAQQFDVEHESPQMIIIRNGKPTHVTSHFEISYNDFRSAASAVEK